MPAAELIAIGTELLLGEIQDTNSRFLAKILKDNNIDLFRITLVGDNAQRVASLVQEALQRSEIIITTGGLGPTIDDPTREALALAFHTTNEYHPELWGEVESRFIRRDIQPTENNRRQAFLPQGAEVIHNPVGTAPAFYMTSNNRIVICLPGVPREMETLMQTEVIPLLRKKYALAGIIKARVIHIADVGESAVDAVIGEYEKMQNPTVGLLAHPGIVDVCITAKADSISEADQMILEYEEKIKSQFLENIFGFDEETLPQTVINLANKNHLTVHVLSSGFENKWPRLLENKSSNPFIIENTASIPERSQSLSIPTGLVEVIFNYSETESECFLEFSLHSPKNREYKKMMYNGPLPNGPIWAANLFLESLRKFILTTIQQKGYE